MSQGWTKIQRKITLGASTLKSEKSKLKLANAKVFSLMPVMVERLSLPKEDIGGW